MHPSTGAGPRSAQEHHRLLRETLGSAPAGRPQDRRDEHCLEWRREACAGRVWKQRLPSGRTEQHPGSSRRPTLTHALGSVGEACGRGRWQTGCFSPCAQADTRGDLAPEVPTCPPLPSDGWIPQLAWGGDLAGSLSLCIVCGMQPAWSTLGELWPSLPESPLRRALQH